MLIRKVGATPRQNAEAQWHAYYGAAQSMIVATFLVAAFTEAYLLMVAMCLLAQAAMIASRRAFQRVERGLSCEAAFQATLKRRIIEEAEKASRRATKDPRH